MVGILILCGLLLFLVYLLRKKNPLDEIPGPKPWPFIGNVHQLDVDKLFVQLSSLAKQYGGIYRIYRFTRPVVVVNDFRFIYEVLVKQSADFAGRYNNYRGTIIQRHLTSIVGADAGPELSGRRKTVQTFMKQYGSGIQIIEDVTQTAMDHLIQRFAETSGNPIYVRDSLMLTTLDIIEILLVGYTSGEKDRQTLKRVMDLAFEAASPSNGMMLDMFPFVRYLGNKNYKQLEEIIRMKDNIVHGWFGGKPNEGFVNVLQSMSEEQQLSSYLEDLGEREKVAFELVIGGTFSTSTSIVGLLNVLCQYPDLEQKLRQEIMDVIGPSRHPTLKDQAAMPYLRATILETGRFISVAALALPHKTMKTCKLDKYTIPKDVEVWVNLWALHHDDAFWDEPHKFRPERFLDADGQLVAADHPNRKHIMPFGAGNRVCVGEVFAMSRMFLIIARILQNFSILPESTIDQQPSCDPRAMRMGAGLFAPDFKVRIIPVDEQDD